MAAFGRINAPAHPFPTTRANILERARPRNIIPQSHLCLSLPQVYYERIEIYSLVRKPVIGSVRFQQLIKSRTMRYYVLLLIHVNRRNGVSELDHVFVAMEISFFII